MTSSNQHALARRFKVSQVTVSRALRGDKGVSEKLRRQIVAEAARTGYRLEAGFAARAMRDRGLGRTSETNVVCAILPGDLDDHSFTGRLLRGISDQGARDGNEVVFLAPMTCDKLPLIVARQQVDGVIWMLGDIAVQEGRASCPLPWVSIFFDVPPADLVTVDQSSGGRVLGEHLGALGHRTVAYVGPDMELAHQRLAGARAGLATAGGRIPDELVLLRRYGANPRDTSEFVDRLLAIRSKSGGSAIMAYNDYMASFALQRLQEHGLRVPEDISVTGFDGAAPAALNTPALTTAVVPLEEVGAEAVRLLAWRLANPNAQRRKVMLDTALRVGTTTAAVAAPAGM